MGEKGLGLGSVIGEGEGGEVSAWGWRLLRCWLLRGEGDGEGRKIGVEVGCGVERRGEEGCEEWIGKVRVCRRGLGGHCDCLCMSVSYLIMHI